MRSFTIEVYSCEQCPHADHDAAQCLAYIDQKIEQEGYSETEDYYSRSEEVYRENCHELCDSCPRVQ